MEFVAIFESVSASVLTKNRLESFYQKIQKLMYFEWPLPITTDNVVGIRK